MALSFKVGERVRITSRGNGHPHFWASDRGKETWEHIQKHGAYLTYDIKKYSMNAGYRGEHTLKIPDLYLTEAYKGFYAKGEMADFNFINARIEPWDIEEKKKEMAALPLAQTMLGLYTPGSVVRFSGTETGRIYSSLTVDFAALERYYLGVNNDRG